MSLVANGNSKAKGQKANEQRPSNGKANGQRANGNKGDKAKGQIEIKSISAKIATGCWSCLRMVVTVVIGGSNQC